MSTVTKHNHLTTQISITTTQCLQAGAIALQAGDTALKLRTMALQDRHLMNQIRELEESLRRDALSSNNATFENPAVEHKLWELENACLELEARSREWDEVRTRWLVKRGECRRRVEEMLRCG